MPLTKEQQTMIKDGITSANKSLAEAKVDLTTAKRAGIDVTEQEKQVQELTLQLRKLKAVYG